jgi:hypothetical protein
MVLFAAIRQHGAPEAPVSDSGGVFRAKRAERMDAALREPDRGPAGGRAR